MRQLTLKGYLESYVPYLAGEDTLGLSRLAQHLPKEPRLVVPMLLWAAVAGRGDRLSRLLQSEEQRQELEVLMSLQSASLLEAALAAEDPQLRPEYAKAWRSFVARRDASRRDSDLKLEARRRALDLACEKGVTRYRMARDLNLNDGNLHAFLAQGKSNALSLERAFDLVKYLEAAQPRERPAERLRIYLQSVLRTVEQQCSPRRAVSERRSLREELGANDAIDPLLHPCRPGESDVDLLVELRPMESCARVDAYFGMLEDLQALLGTEVDLVMVGAVKNRYVAAQIERTKQVVYAA